MDKYVIAGVSGRVGRAAANQLLAQGLRPTVIARDEAKGREWVARGAEVAQGSLDDRAFLTRALAGAVGFFTLLPENVTPNDFHGTRRRMVDSVAAAIRDAGVPHVVLLSAVAAVLEDGNGPAKDLYYAEHRLRGSGAKLSAFRSCYFQDNVHNALGPARQSGVYLNFFPSADVALPMIATLDVGRHAARELLDPPADHQVVDLLGPMYSAREVSRRLGAALGRELEVVSVPAAHRLETLLLGGVPPQLAEAIAEMFEAFEAGKIAPQGDRCLQGTTTIDEVIRDCMRLAPVAPV